MLGSVFMISAKAYSVALDTPKLHIKVTRVGKLKKKATVDFHTQDMTDDSYLYYTPVKGTLIFHPGYEATL